MNIDEKENERYKRAILKELLDTKDDIAVVIKPKKINFLKRLIFVLFGRK